MHATLVEFHRRFPDVDVRTVDGSEVAPKNWTGC
jgi:hypothetical protein